METFLTNNTYVYILYDISIVSASFIKNNNNSWKKKHPNFNFDTFVKSSWSLEGIFIYKNYMGHLLDSMLQVWKIYS